MAYGHAKGKGEDFVRLRNEGYDPRDIAKMMGVSKSSVYRVLSDCCDESVEARHERLATARMEEVRRCRDEIRIGDTVVFQKNERHVMAEVTSKQKFTLTCVEVHPRGWVERHSPQYQDILDFWG